MKLYVLMITRHLVSKARWKFDSSCHCPSKTVCLGSVSISLQLYYISCYNYTKSMTKTFFSFSRCFYPSDNIFSFINVRPNGLKVHQNICFFCLSEQILRSCKLMSVWVSQWTATKKIPLRQRMGHRHFSTKCQKQAWMNMLAHLVSSF